MPAGDYNPGRDTGNSPSSSSSAFRLISSFIAWQQEVTRDAFNLVTLQDTSADNFARLGRAALYTGVAVVAWPMGPLFAASMFVGMHKLDTAIFGERSDALSTFGNSLDRTTTHFVMGATDTITMGGSAWLRKTISHDVMGQDWDGIHEDAFAYKAGQVAGGRGGTGG
jgi:hypothetical protein